MKDTDTFCIFNIVVVAMDVCCMSHSAGVAVCEEVSHFAERFAEIAKNRVFSSLLCDAELDQLSIAIKGVPDDTYRDVLIDLLTTYDSYSAELCGNYCSFLSKMQEEYAYFLLRVFDLRVDNYYSFDLNNDRDLTRAKKRARIA